MRLAILLSALIIGIAINEKLTLKLPTAIGILGVSALFAFMDLYELFW